MPSRFGITGGAFRHRPGLASKETIVIIADLVIDLDAVFAKRRTLIEETAAVAPADLRGLTIELYDRIDRITDGVTDEEERVIAGNPAEDGAPGWNLAHVAGHVTAGLEEDAAQGCTLARGVQVTGRSRYEIPWEEVTAAAQVRQRLAESRRMSLAFLDAWPDRPHLDNVYDHPAFGTTNAAAFHVLGLFHGRGYLAQFEEIVRQAAAASASSRSVAV